MRIAILTKPDYRSPRILAESLQSQLEEQRVTVDIFYEISLLTRLVSYKESKLRFHFWLKDKWRHYFKDREVLNSLLKYDVIIISECTPNGFLRKLYNVEKLKQIVQKPILFFEVYYLGIVPKLIDMLKSNREALPDRYDIHLSVSQVNDMKLHPSDKWFSLGLLAKGFNLYPKPKKEFIAILDFEQINFLEQREVQIKALQRADIKYMLLQNEYTFEELRKIYMEGAIFLLQTPEAFGISILECLCCGTQIFTPANWPLAWRISVNHSSWGEGTLAECFTEYLDEDELVKKLLDFKNNYNLTETPINVFRNFLANYPQYYNGNETEIIRFLNTLNEMKLKKND